MLSTTEVKALRDTARQQMEMMRMLNNPETYKSAKMVYSNLCADYFDAIGKRQVNALVEKESSLEDNFEDFL